MLLNIDPSTLRARNLCPNFNLIRQDRVPLLGIIEMPLEVAMMKTVLVATTALVLAGSALAYADPGHRGHAKHHWRPSAEDVAAFGDARIAGLHAGLRLTVEQDKNWPAVEASLKDIAKQRSERFAARASADKPKDALDRMAVRGEQMESRGSALKKFAEAAAPLYESLDAGQKHRFVRLARAAVRPAGHWQGHRHSHPHHEWKHHRSHDGQSRHGQEGNPQQPQ
jgi:hypothetical protein